MSSIFMTFGIKFIKKGENDKMKFGKQLKQHREQAKITQSELAKATKITQAAISRWEDDLRIPNIENCVILADFYGISVDELIGHEIKKNW